MWTKSGDVKIQVSAFQQCNYTVVFIVSVLYKMK